MPSIFDGLSFDDWTKAVKAQGGAAVVWPDVWPAPWSDYAGKPAARYSADQYSALFNSGGIDASAPQATPGSGPASNKYFWVLAPKSAADSAPQDRLTPLQAFENQLFTHGDQLANAVHLPSLADLEKWIKEPLVILGVIVLVAFLAYLWAHSRSGRPSI